MFLRGYGSQSFSQNNGIVAEGGNNTTYKSGEVGKIQGDGIRHFWANFGSLYGQIVSSDMSKNSFYSVQNYTGLAYVSNSLAPSDHQTIEYAVVTPNNYDRWLEALKYWKCGEGYIIPPFNVSQGHIAPDYLFDSRRGLPTANEIRPVNVAVRYYIKAK